MNKSREFKIVKTIFAIGFISVIYLGLVIGVEKFVGETPDTTMRAIFGIISFVLMWAFYSKIEKFTEQLLDQNRDDLQRGGGIGKNSLQD